MGLILKTLPLSKGEYPEGGREYDPKMGSFGARCVIPDG